MSLYFRTFLASFLITFLSPDDIHWHIYSFYVIADYDVRFILGMVLSVWTCWGGHTIIIIINR
jgi:hypothetical protein